MEKTIVVKDMDWLAEMYGWNKVVVYVGETKAEHDLRLSEELKKIQYDRDNGYSGFDEDHNE